jgi:DNA-binding SARP family transcriptional activator
MVSLALLIGMPVVLVVVLGWPFPHEIPNSTTMSQWLDKPLTTTFLIDTAAIVLWLLWALLTAAVVAEMTAAVRRAPVAVPGWSGLWRRLVAAVVGMLGVAVASGTAHATTVVLSTAAPVPPDDFAGSDSLNAAPPALPHGLGMLVINGCAHPYTVRLGDTLWHIAQECLGDGERWPEIWRLNKGGFWPEVSGTVRFNDPNLIYPRWTLRLPNDATPPGTSTKPAATPKVPATPTPPTRTAPLGPAHSDPPSPITAGRAADGVLLPGGSWIPWTLAGALVATAGVVWAQRRRRYVPRPIDQFDEKPPLALPRIIDHARRAWNAHRRAVGVTPESSAPASMVVPSPMSATVIGLVGEGAVHAARGALVTALSSGKASLPGQRTRVVIAADMLAELLGTDPSSSYQWPRLRIADTLDQALTTAEEHLLRTARNRDEGPGADPKALVGPLVLLTGPPGSNSQRLHAILQIRHDAEISAIILGEWPGNTVHIDADGTSHSEVGTPLRRQFALLNAAETLDLLNVLREADTGEPTVTPAPAPLSIVIPPQPAAPAQETDSAEPSHAQAEDEASADSTSSDNVGASAKSGKAQLRVLGRPEVLNRPADIPMRGYATEIMVYLAVHADGAPSEQILDDLWPAERRHITANRLYTGVSNLRKILAASVGDHIGAIYVDKRNGRYRLNPETVDVDLWRLRAGHTAARAAARHDQPARIAGLRRACLAGNGLLAAGESYEWIEPHRHGTLKLALDDHTALAVALQDDRPEEAARLLGVAFSLDQANEILCRAAMTAHHRTGNIEAIRSLLQTLTRALADIGEKPTSETATLVARLTTARPGPESQPAALPTR